MLPEVDPTLPAMAASQHRKKSRNNDGEMVTPLREVDVKPGMVGPFKSAGQFCPLRSDAAHTVLLQLHHLWSVACAMARSKATVALASHAGYVLFGRGCVRRCSRVGSLTCTQPTHATASPGAPHSYVAQGRHASFPSDISRTMCPQPSLPSSRGVCARDATPRSAQESRVALRGKLGASFARVVKTSLRPLAYGTPLTNTRNAPRWERRR